MNQPQVLTVTDHNRNVYDMRYLYPVVSRRAQGVSIGINLNVNNACNWRCIYCQVPDLKRGTPPAIDLAVLTQELDIILHDVLHGEFMQRHVAAEDRHLQDIAFSGNGEPTSAKEFPQVLEIVERALNKYDLLGKIKVRLITNGSLADRPSVLNGLKHLASLGGEVWFKVDTGSEDGFARTNDVTLQPQTHIERLKQCAAVCPTYVQTCMFALDDLPPSDADVKAYVDLVAQVQGLVQGVHLYGYARPSYQVEAPRISRLSESWLEGVANLLRARGFEVFVSP